MSGPFAAATLFQTTLFHFYSDRGIAVKQDYPCH